MNCETAGVHRASTGRRQRTGGVFWSWRAGLSLLAVAANLTADEGEGQRIQYSRTSPQLPYTAPAPINYNLKYGNLTARLSGSVDSEYNDNIDLANRNAQSDFSVGARMGLGFRLPITQANIMQFDLEMGYRWYLNHPSINSINVAPNTHWDQTIILEQVRFNFHDAFSIQVDPLTRQEISGARGQLINFRRLHNVAGVSVDWQPARRWVFFGGYDYTTDFGLSDDFRSIDRNDHSFNGGVEYQISQRLSARISGGYTFSEYAQKIQNGGDSYSVGPGISWHPTKRIDIDASVSYWVSSFDQTGTIGDKSQFAGEVFSISARQTLNRHTSHNVRFSRTIGLGLGSNYTDGYTVQYGLLRQLSRNISINANLAYEPFQSSGIGGEMGNRYLFNVGTGFQLTKAWHAGLGYGFAWKDSSVPNRNYTQNRLTLDLTRRF